MQTTDPVAPHTILSSPIADPPKITPNSHDPRRHLPLSLRPPASEQPSLPPGTRLPLPQPPPFPL